MICLVVDMLLILVNILIASNKKNPTRWYNLIVAIFMMCMASITNWSNLP